MSPFTEDLSAFFGSSTTFGNDAATYGATTWYGILDKGYAEVEGMAGTAPRFTCAKADIPGGVVVNTQISINGVYYNVAVFQDHDDGAVTTLVLWDKTV